MPIKIPDTLPAARILQEENIFVMTNKRAETQDIRPLKILLLNLMPKKVETETQFLRLLSNSPLQVDIDLLQMASHESKNTSQEHLIAFYKVFDDVKNNKYDGMIITGAPVERMPFEEVDYWDELCTIMEWSKTHVWSTIHICWGAQAGLYYHYGINKYDLENKITGVFHHHALVQKHPLLRGYDDFYYAPHSRYTGIKREDVEKCEDLDLLTYSEDAGVHIVSSKDGRKIFVTGHSEYDRTTLAGEYERDEKKEGSAAPMPQNYFVDDATDSIPPLVWRAHASLLFSNWLNYFVYQQTPFNLEDLK